jgi:hypothetical protein
MPYIPQKQISILQDYNYFQKMTIYMCLSIFWMEHPKHMMEATSYKLKSPPRHPFYLLMKFFQRVRGSVLRCPALLNPVVKPEPIEASNCLLLEPPFPIFPIPPYNNNIT